MGWQEDLKQLGEQLTSGEITTDEYRKRSESVLAEADQEAADATQPTEKPKPHIPVSAAWEAPSGEMTQIVGMKDETTLVSNSIADKLDRPDT
jgi:hypothetical protein